MHISTKNLCLAISVSLLFSATLLSCKKENKQDPVPDTVFNEQKLTAHQWEVYLFKLFDFTNDTLMHGYVFEKNRYAVEDGQNLGSEPWIKELHATYINFNTSHSFFHTNMYGEPDGYMLTAFLPYEGGTWSLKDSKTLSLTSKSLFGGQVAQQDWEILDYNGYALLIGKTDSVVDMGNRKRTLCTIEFIPKE